MLLYALCIVALGVIINLQGKFIALRNIGKLLTSIARHSRKQSSIGFQPVSPAQSVAKALINIPQLPSLHHDLAPFPQYTGGTPMLLYVLCVVALGVITNLLGKVHLSREATF
jgi:hypothetical protein